MKNVIKRVLSFMMVLAMVIVVVPASKVKAYTPVTLEVNGATKDDVFQLYKIVNIVFDEVHNNVTYEWANDDIADAINMTVEAFKGLDSDERQEALAGVPAILEDTDKYKTTVTADASGIATWTNVEVGGYLVMPTSTTDVYQMMLVIVQPKQVGSSYVVSDTEITTKKEDLSITKTATTGETTGAIQTVKYEIVTKMPVYDDGATEKTFIIADTLASGLELVPGSVKVYGSADGSSYDADALSTGFTTPSSIAIDVSVGTPEEQAKKAQIAAIHTNPSFVLDFDYDALKAEGYNYIKVVCSAKLTTGATAGSHDNDVVLKYSNYPFTAGNYEYATDKETVDTYKVTIWKDNAAGDMLTGAEFSLYRQLSASTTMSVDEITTALEQLEIFESKDVVLGGSGNAVPQLPTGTYILVGTFTPDVTDGHYSIDKIDAGDYQIVETKAPTGYTLPNASYPVTVDADKDDDIDGLVNNVIISEIENNSGFTLPETGGTGTVIFTVVGVSLMCFAVLALFLLRKKEVSKN